MLAYETEALATEAEAETKAFSVETEAKTKTFSLEAEARPRYLKFQPRRDRAKALLRLETASRPRRQDRGHITDHYRLHASSGCVLYLWGLCVYVYMYVCTLTQKPLDISSPNLAGGHWTVHDKYWSPSFEVKR